MTAITLTSSSEMMTNYLQGQFISPQKKFLALQSGKGHALLFSIGTDGVFYLIQEKSGMSVTGWSKTDLSTARIQADFPRPAEVNLHTFAAGQREEDGSLGIAMVVGTSDGDRLYLCLRNSNEDVSWANSPRWVPYQYDNPHMGFIGLPKLKIVNVFFCQPYQAKEYIIVDVLRDPDSDVKLIRRFYIDPEKRDNYYWHLRDLPIDLDSELDKYQNCIGRPQRDRIDGLYTTGSVEQSPQFIFHPVINVYNPSVPPSVIRLKLSGNAMPDAIATARTRTNMSTDVFVVSDNTLHCFLSDEQTNDATGRRLISDEVMSGTSDLTAMSRDGVITLWGRNRSNQVYYTSCEQSKISDPSAWVKPIPLLSGIEKMSSYINKIDGGNTIFASGGGHIFRIIQEPQSKIWQTHQITLPSLPEERSISFNSYTTRIQVSDERELPVRGAVLTLSASSHSGVYINGSYYVLEKVPIEVKADSVGSLTIVESTESLNGTIFTASVKSDFIDNSPITVDPAEMPFQKLAELNTLEKLRNATINEGNGATRPLVPSSAGDNEVEAVALALKKLSKVYDQVRNNRVVAYSSVIAQMDLGDDIIAAAGDIFRWLKSGVEAVIDVIEDTVTHAVCFIAKIAGKTYRAVLDSIEAVVGAVEWVFSIVKTAIEDIIKYVAFLFEWEDIKRTKEVLHNLIKRYFESWVGEIGEVKDDFNDAINNVKNLLNELVGVDDWSSLGSVTSGSVSGSASNPMKSQTSASQYLFYHFQNNAQNVSSGGITTPDVLQSLADKLLNALKEEATLFDGVLDELYYLVNNFSDLTVEEILKRLAKILLDGLLNSIQVVGNILFEILLAVVSEFIGILDAKIHIPVISDILKSIGVDEFSLLDLLCWMSAVAYTVVYKALKDKAPFPDNEYTTFLKTASSFSELQQAFGQPPLALTAGASEDIPELPQDVKDVVFMTGHFVTAYTFFGAGMIGAISASASVGPGDDFAAYVFGIAGIVPIVLVGVTNYLVPKAPIREKSIKWLGYTTTTLRVLLKIFFLGPVQSKFKASEGVLKRLLPNNGRATGAVLDAILVVPGLVCTGWHFYELLDSDDSNEKTAAILEEVSNFGAYTSRVAYTVAVNTKSPKIKAFAAGVIVTASTAYAGLQVGEGLIPF